MKSGFSTTQPFHPSLLRDFVAWVKQPTYRLHPGEGISLWSKIYIILRTWSLSTLAIGISAILVTAILTLAGAAQTEHALSEFLLNESAVMAFVFAVIVAPIQEELSFRLWLLPRRNTIAFGLSAFLWFFAITLLAQFIPAVEKLITHYDIAATLIAGWLILGILFSFLIRVTRSLSRIQVFFQKNLRHIIIASVLIFSLAHIVNYPEIASIWYLTPFLILPQVIISFPLAYIRIKLGLIWSIIYHALHNGFLMLPILILRLTSSNTDLENIDLTHITTEHTTLIGLLTFLYLLCASIGMILVVQVLLEARRQT